MSQEIQEMQTLLAELPDIALPESLTAEALFARMDAGELAQPKTSTRMGRVIDLTRRMRPALSYAAVFILMVVVYYGTGMDQAAGSYDSLTAPQVSVNEMTGQARMADEFADAPTAPQLMMAAPETEGGGQVEGYSMKTENAQDNEAATPNAVPEAAPQTAPPVSADTAPRAAAAAALRLIAVVQVGQETVLELDLENTADGELALPETVGFAMTLEVKDKAIRIARADCSDQQCVKAGFISQENAMVCCLRDEVLITLVKK